MDTPLRRLSGGSRPRFHILLQNLHFKLSLVESNQINHIGFWKFSKKVLRALNNQSCKRPSFDLLRHRKFQKLTNSLVTLHSAKNRLYFFIVWIIRGLESISILICVYSEARHISFKNTQLLYFFIVWIIRGLESISILICVYSEARHISFKNTQLSEIGQKYSFFLSWEIFLKSRPDHWKLRLIPSNKMFESIEM